MIAFSRLHNLISYVLFLSVVVSAVPMPIRQASNISVLPHSVYLGFYGQTAGFATSYLAAFVRLEGLGKTLSSGVNVNGDITIEERDKIASALFHEGVNSSLAQFANVLASNPNDQLTQSEKEIYVSEIKAILEDMGQICEVIGNQTGTQSLKGELNTADTYLYQSVMPENIHTRRDS